MTKLAWDSYVQFAWGANELKPISRTGHSASIFGMTSMGATIVDSLDTLYIMNLTEEYKKGKDWVATSLNFDNVSTMIPFCLYL
jgi:mannosyl-oligosaccharide alpha-1,2-mannosidase